MWKEIALGSFAEFEKKLLNIIKQFNKSMMNHFFGVGSKKSIDQKKQLWS